MGSVAVDKSKELHFPCGIIGFEDCKTFSLVQLQDESVFWLLQSMERSELGLLVTDPFSFLTDYEVKVGQTEQNILQIKTINDVAVLVTVDIPKGNPQNMALHLSGPILINRKARIGLQVPQSNPRYTGKFYLKELIDQAEKLQEKKTR